jgi:ASC-1-like (ASCH) protein
MSELDKISLEFSGMFGGDEKFRKIYAKATEQRYDFLYLDLQSNPARAFRNFEEQLAEGDKLLFNDNVSLEMPE